MSLHHHHETESGVIIITSVILTTFDKNDGYLSKVINTMDSCVIDHGIHHFTQ